MIFCTERLSAGVERAVQVMASGEVANCSNPVLPEQPMTNSPAPRATVSPVSGSGVFWFVQVTPSGDVITMLPALDPSSCATSQRPEPVGGGGAGLTIWIVTIAF